MSRQQLPSGITKLELQRRKDGRQIVRYQILTDVTKVNGQRKRIRTRKNGEGQPLATEAMARAELARIQNDVATHNFVQRRRTTVEQACEAWLESKQHGLKPSTYNSYVHLFTSVRQELGDIELQRLEKRDVDLLIKRLLAGDVPNHDAWKPTSINKLLGRFEKLLDDAKKQGHVQRNVVKLIDRLPQEKPELKILSQEEMFKILDNPDRDSHVWALALYGLRAGEMAGLRWSNVDFDKRTIAVVENRVTFGRESVVGTPKSRASRRTLPMPDEVYQLLLDARGRIESEYVVCNERGEPLKTPALAHRWMRMLQRVGIDHVRLHDARHSCASLMYARGVNIATISAWLGHASTAVTTSIYVHSHPESLNEAATSFGRTYG